jgi:hypothetical protein
MGARSNLTTLDIPGSSSLSPHTTVALPLPSSSSTPTDNYYSSLTNNNETQNNAGIAMLSAIHDPGADFLGWVEQEQQVNIGERHVLKNTFGIQETDDEGHEDVPRKVGQNIYILAHQLSRFSPALAEALQPQQPADDSDTATAVRVKNVARSKLTKEKNANTIEALDYYRKHTAQIEIVRADRSLERVVFPMPDDYSHLSLTAETRERVQTRTERDTTGSKVPAFFAQWRLLYDEMRWQCTLRREHQWLQVCCCWDKIVSHICQLITEHRQLWSYLAIFFAFVVNTLVALTYPSCRLPSAANSLFAVYELVRWPCHFLCYCVGLVNAPSNDETHTLIKQEPPAIGESR